MSKVKPGIPVCWVESSGSIKWGNAIRVEGKGVKASVLYDDGGWNYAEDCFLTEAQCRAHNHMVADAWCAKLLAENKRLQHIVSNIDNLVEWAKEQSQAKGY